MTYHLGRVPSRPDPRDRIYSLAYAQEAPNLPASFFPVVLSPVLDQGQTPRCVTYSGDAIRTLQELGDESHLLSFDSDELYARCKEQDGAPTEDGTEIRIAAAILKNRGALVTASTDSTEVGSFRPISAYARLSTVSEIKTTVLQDGAAWIGIDWYDSWFNTQADGTLPQPDTVAGGHAVSIIGWDDQHASGGAWYIQNNWSDQWGLSGRAWLPCSYVNFTGSDEAWRTVDVVGDAPSPPAPTPDPVPTPTPDPTPTPPKPPKPPKPKKKTLHELLDEVLTRLEDILAELKK